MLLASLLHIKASSTVKKPKRSQCQLQENSHRAGAVEDSCEASGKAGSGLDMTSEGVKNCNISDSFVTHR